MAGTMGSAVEPDIDPEDPDSDIPNELQILLSSTSINGEEVEETLSYRQPGACVLLEHMICREFIRF
jgi:hypothetical protein